MISRLRRDWEEATEWYEKLAQKASVEDMHGGVAFSMKGLKISDMSDSEHSWLSSLYCECLPSSDTHGRYSIRQKQYKIFLTIGVNITVYAYNQP